MPNKFKKGKLNLWFIHCFLQITGFQKELEIHSKPIKS